MSFRNLDVSELASVVEFFAVEIEAADLNKPSKKELLAALAAGDKPVTWEDYETIYLPTVEKMRATEVKPEPAPVVVEEVIVVEEPEENVILKMERENPRFDIYGYTFTKEHPYRPVTEDAAEFIMATVEGFRPATPREVADYYN